MKLKNLLILLFISIVATASAQLKDYSMFAHSITVPHSATMRYLA